MDNKDALIPRLKVQSREFFEKFSESITELINNEHFIKDTSILVGIIATAIIIYVFDKYPNFIYENRKTIFYISIVLIPLYLGLSGINIDGDSDNIMKSSTMYVIYLLGAAYMFMMFYNYVDLSNYQLEMAQYIFMILIFVAVIGFLAIAYRIFNNYLRSLDGTLGFISYFMFYIPCMLSDFITYILSEFKSTTNDVYILFLLELVVVLLIVYYPDIIDAIYNASNDIVLLHKPDYLNKKTTIYNMEDLKKESVYINSELIKNKGISKNYSLSLWVYVNPEAAVNTNNEYSLFSFDGKPELKFKYNTINNDTEDASVILKEKEKSYVYRAYLSNIHNSNSDLEYVDLQAPIQKWVNIVFNYKGNNVDIFVDGELQQSKLLEKLPTFSDYDTITIGDDLGISGSICNINYYTDILTRRQIAQMYNVYSNLNPPIL
jgi:hypothetical protein